MEQSSPFIPPTRLEPLLNKRPHLRPVRPIILLIRRARVGGRLERRRQGGEEELYELGIELAFYAGSVCRDVSVIKREREKRKRKKDDVHGDGPSICASIRSIERRPAIEEVLPRRVAEIRCLGPGVVEQDERAYVARAIDLFIIVHSTQRTPSSLDW